MTTLLRKQLGPLALLPFLLWSCADDPTAQGVMAESKVLASGYWIADGIAVIGEGEFLFADRAGPHAAASGAGQDREIGRRNARAGECSRFWPADRQSAGRGVRAEDHPGAKTTGSGSTATSVSTELAMKHSPCAA